MPPTDPAPQDASLLDLARQVAERAYSPYSKIRVGAALQARDGRVFTGCNVENASYGLTICAERSAMVAAVSQGVREFESIAIVGSAKSPMMPCGACRQFMAEFGLDLRLILDGTEGTPVVATLDQLLPEAYGPKDHPGGAPSAD